MRQWALEVLRDFQILNRRGKKWAVVHVSMHDCTLREIVYAQPMR